MQGQTATSWTLSSWSMNGVIVTFEDYNYRLNPTFIMVFIKTHFTRLKGVESDYVELMCLVNANATEQAVSPDNT